MHFMCQSGYALFGSKYEPDGLNVTVNFVWRYFATSCGGAPVTNFFATQMRRLECRI